MLGLEIYYLALAVFKFRTHILTSLSFKVYQIYIYSIVEKCYRVIKRMLIFTIMVLAKVVCHLFPQVEDAALAYIAFYAIFGYGLPNAVLIIG